MFCPDINELYNYYSSPLGEMTQYHILHEVSNMWPDMANKYVIGLGYAIPYLPVFEKHKNVSVLSFMHAAQGAMYWPQSKPGRNILVDESELPLADNQIHRMLVIHALEHTAHPRRMIKEMWRIMAPAGKIILILPNRGGMWSRVENNPFSYGRPYSQNQIRKLLKKECFTVLRCEQALFFPPCYPRFTKKIANGYESFAKKWLPFFGGVWIIEAQKQMYGFVKKEKNSFSKYAKIYTPYPAEI